MYSPAETFELFSDRKNDTATKNKGPFSDATCLTDSLRNRLSSQEMKFGGPASRADETNQRTLSLIFAVTKKTPWQNAKVEKFQVCNLKVHLRRSAWSCDYSQTGEAGGEGSPQRRCSRGHGARTLRLNGERRRETPLTDFLPKFCAGLPDFSLHNIPKQGKI
jgi:hypothetical protein